MKRTFLITVMLSWFAEMVTAQTPPSKEWDARFGGSEYDLLFSIQQTADGGYILFVKLFVNNEWYTKQVVISK